MSLGEGVVIGDLTAPSCRWPDAVLLTHRFWDRAYDRLQFNYVYISGMFHLKAIAQIKLKFHSFFSPNFRDMADGSKTER